MQSLGQNWILLSKSAQKRFNQFISGGRKVSKFLILLVCFTWKINFLNQKVWQEFHFVTEKIHGKFGSELNPAFQISPRPSQKKLDNFFPVGKKGPNFKLFYSFVFCKSSFPSTKEFWQVFHFVILKRGSFWNLIQFLPKRCMALQCQKNKILVKSFASNNLSFRQNKPIKFQIWTLFVSSK